MNPLIESFDTPFQTIPFDRIETKHFKPAIEHWINVSRARISSIRDAKDTPTFDNTIAALDYCQEELNRVASAFFNLNSAETNDELQALAQEISPLLSAFGNDIVLDETLYQRIKSVSDIPEAPEAEMLMEKTRLAFERNGANLPDDKKEELREIDQALGRLCLTFAENVLRDTNAYSFYIDREDELAGLPDYVVERAEEAAKANQKDGSWMFSLRPDSYLDFMKYSAVRKHRETMYRAFIKRGKMTDDKSNVPVIKQLVELRRKRALLLGYTSHAEYVLQERMAKSPTTVADFLNTLKEHALPVAKDDLQALQSFAKSKDGIDALQSWDMAYYSEKLKKAKLNVDDEALKPYLALPAVVGGIFDIANRLFGIRFTKKDDIPVYHKDVEAYEVTDDEGKHLAVFYMDLFPRDGKRGGAWMTAYRGQWKKDGEDYPPHISIVCNFNRPTNNRPAMLTFQELTTFFHEFGHALHGMLAKGTYPSLSGTNVYWDFVELPSQLMENWCYEKDALDLFARHIDTGERIPEDMVNNIRKQRVFLEGYATVRQLSFGYLDMAWHSLTKNAAVPSIEALEADATGDLRLLPEVEDSSISTAFNHIFHGAYSAGYYSYKWSEMLEVQAFKLFEANGLFDAETARKYKELLEAGGSVHPAKLFRIFTGDDPNPLALLERLIK
jgi:peptidyl-dipeptidase Dcp